MIVFLTSTDSELEAHRQQVSEMLRQRGDAMYTVRHAATSPLPEDRIAALTGTDVVVCILGAGNGPELSDGTGYAETEVGAARRMGIRVLAYRCDGALATATSSARGPLHDYSVARARRFRNWLREQYGVRRVATADQLVAAVADELDAMRSDAEAAGPSVIRQIHSRLRARPSTTFDAFTISLHNMDALYRVEQIAPYREEHVDPPRCSPGGGGANVIHALARLGMRTAVAGVVAADADGDAVRSDLERVGVNTELLLQLPAESPQRTGRATVLADARGRRTIFTEEGANSRLTAEVSARGLRQPLQQCLSRSRIVLLTSFTSVAERQLQEEMLETLPADTVVAFTPGSLYGSPGPGRLAPLIGRTNVIFLSEEALTRLLDDLVPHMHDQSATVPQKAHALLQWRYDMGSRDPMIVAVRQQWRGYDARAGFRHISICWGRKGYEGMTGTDGRLSSDDADTLIDGTGTGGAMAAGVLYGLLRSRPPEDCANLAYVLVMSAATRYGSRDGVPSSHQIRERWCHWLHVDAAPSWL